METANVSDDRADDLADSMSHSDPNGLIRVLQTPSVPRTGPNRLLLAILEDGLEQLFTHAVARIQLSGKAFAANRHYKKGRAWLDSPAVLYGSFAFCCQHLRLDPDWLRLEIFRQLTAIEQKTRDSVAVGLHTGTLDPLPMITHTKQKGFRRDYGREDLRRIGPGQQPRA